METFNDWESKIELNGHSYSNTTRNENAVTKQDEDKPNNNGENVDSEQGTEENQNATRGRKPEDPESKGITEGDKGNNPGSQDGNRGTGKK